MSAEQLRSTRNEFKEFLWWIACKIWDPIIPGAAGCVGMFATPVYVLRWLGDSQRSMVLAGLGIIAGLMVFGGGTYLVQYLLLKLTGFPDLFVDDYDPPQEYDHFYDDDPNVG
jgi:hypothetical protein